MNMIFERSRGAWLAVVKCRGAGMTVVSSRGVGLAVVRSRGARLAVAPTRLRWCLIDLETFIRIILDLAFQDGQFSKKTLCVCR